MNPSRRSQARWSGVTGAAFPGAVLAQTQHDYLGNLSRFPLWAVYVGALALLIFWLWWRLAGRYRRPHGYLYKLDDVYQPRFDLTEDVCRIGRSSENEIQLLDRSISRFHAELIRGRNGTVAVVDVSSKNGLRVGPRKVRSCVLKEGDVIKVGHVRLKYSTRARDEHQTTETVEDVRARWDKHRRPGQRLDVAMNVRLYNDDIGWVTGRIRNLGTDGVVVRTKGKTLSPRMPVDVVFPVFDEEDQQLLRASGEVVRVEREGVAVFITEHNPRVRRLLGDAVDDAAGRTIHDAALHAA